MRHRRTDPTCLQYREPRGIVSRWRFNRGRGLSCPRCAVNRQFMDAIMHPLRFAEADAEHDAALEALFAGISRRTKERYRLGLASPETYARRGDVR